MSESSSAAGRLVVVDDEPAILELLASLFRDTRDVHAFSRGAEALAHMRSHGFDVLLTDKNLPDVSGLELLAEARAIVPDAEVIVITGYASLDSALLAMERGAFDYIVKPPKSIFDVRRKVDQAFARQQMARENRRLLEDLRAKNLALEEALEDNRRVQAELIQSEKLAGIGTLAAGIAHEISSPLFGILGLAEAIGEEDDMLAVRRFAAEIVEYSRTIKEIVMQLSGYTRTAEREFLTTIDAAVVLADAAKLVVRTLGLPAGLVTLHIEPGVYFHARTSEVQQIFVNLVKNAVEAAQERHGALRGSVVVSARIDGPDFVATVQDDGPGIPQDAIKEIFDPFYTTKPPGKGTGLGLNIVYRLVTKYRGTITVQSQPGQGATFTVRLPAAE